MSLGDIAFPYRAKRSFGAASFAFVFLMLILEAELVVFIGLGVIAHRWAQGSHTPPAVRTAWLGAHSRHATCTALHAQRGVSAGSAAVYSEPSRRWGCGYAWRRLQTCSSRALGSPRAPSLR